MKNGLNIKTTAFALAVTSAIIYAVCALLIFVFGSAGVSLFANMFHGIDITKIAATNVSWKNTLIGLVEIIVFALLTGALFAWIYNLFVKTK